MGIEALILAAGRGSRLGLENIPKAMVSIGGRPLIDRALYALYSCGFGPNEITTVISRDESSRFLREYLQNDSHFFYQSEPRGTAHALQEYLSVAQPKPDRVFIVQADDCIDLTPTITQDLLRFHINTQADLTMLLTASYDPTHHRKTYQLDSLGNIISISPIDTNRTNRKLYFAGIACFEFSFLNRAFPNLIQVENQGEFSLFNLIKYAYDDESNLKGYPVFGSWLGINTSGQLSRARESAR